MTNLLHSIAAHTARILPLSLKRALYRLGPITKSIRAFLNLISPKSPTQVTVAAGSLIGINIVVNLQNEKDYWLGTYETELQRAIADYTEPGMVCYDIGANIGYISLVFGNVVGPEGQVICFEALAENRERLELNLSLNKKLSNFSIIPKAVSDRKGEEKFLTHQSRAMGKVIGSAGRETRYQDTIIVESISLDIFVFEENNPVPDVIKIDIEGGEILAMAGMQRLLDKVRPIILLELHGTQSAKAVWKALSNFGYTIHRMKPDYPIVNSMEELNWKAYLIALPAE